MMIDVQPSMITTTVTESYRGCTGSPELCILTDMPFDVTLKGEMVSGSGSLCYGRLYYDIKGHGGAFSGHTHDVAVDHMSNATPEACRAGNLNYDVTATLLFANKDNNPLPGESLTLSRFPVAGGVKSFVLNQSSKPVIGIILTYNGADSGVVGAVFAPYGLSGYLSGQMYTYPFSSLGGVIQNGIYSSALDIEYAANLNIRIADGQGNSSDKEVVLARLKHFYQSADSLLAYGSTISLSGRDAVIWPCISSSLVKGGAGYNQGNGYDYNRVEKRIAIRQHDFARCMVEKLPRGGKVSAPVVLTLSIP